MAEKGSEPAQTEAAATKSTGDVEVAHPDVLAPWAWVSDWFEEWPRVFGRGFPMPSWGMPSGAIRVEQYTEGDQRVIRAELPGVDPDRAIEVSVENNRLTIAAHREQREDSKTDQGFRSEFHYGAFRRVVSLPPGTTAEDVKASYADGILEVRVPIDTTRHATARVRIERKQ